MENDETKNTPPDLQTVLEAIGSLQMEMNEHFAKLEKRFTRVEIDVYQIKDLQFTYENELNRLLALSYKSFELNHECHGDVRIMRKEVEAWSTNGKVLEEN